MQDLLILLAGLVAAYLMGSIPTGYLAVKIIARQDIRKLGSGNIGATNVKRVLGMKWFIIVLVLDALKGYLPVSFMVDRYGTGNGQLTSVIPVLTAVAAILGHTFTIFLKFKGGKGVATALGVFLALAPISIFSVFLVFIAILLMYGYISLGSIVAAVLLPCFIFIYGETGFFNIILVFALAGAAFIVYKHKDNIKRLMEGTENKFEFKKKEGKK